MGGLNSGRRPTGRPVFDNKPRIDLRLLRQEGVLDAPTRVDLKFFLYGRDLGGIMLIGVPGGPDGRPGGLIIPSVLSDPPTEPMPSSEPQPLVWDRCRFGGYRAYIRCPCCYRRVLVLALARSKAYGTITWCCRRCADLPYASTLDNPEDAALRRLERLRRRMGFEDWDGAETEFPHYPLRPWRAGRWEALQAQANKARDTYFDLVESREWSACIVARRYMQRWG